uniref:Pre-mRNA-processing factor 17 n=1 Tax=Lotharella oceanica TaxID=641309 RepID=A0A7S2TJD6_9EUKA|mmetsp:Transcript_16944/g.32121  ORF Transcript_16944/g.32121 Transcript_16944/m.32121 type:complete len:560 (+) Transcript_16944:83-1762(+)
MDLLAAYDDSDEEQHGTKKARSTDAQTNGGGEGDGEGDEGGADIPQPSGSSVVIQDLAPAVDLSLESNPYYVKTDTKVVYHNPRVEDLWKPVAGPKHPDDINPLGVANNTYLGHIEKCAMNEFVFAEQFHTFNNFGYAVNPSDQTAGNTMVGDVGRHKKNKGKTVFGGSNGSKKKRKRIDPLEWKKHVEVPELTEEQKAEIAADKTKMRGHRKAIESAAETTEFHGKVFRDYQDRTYMHVPHELKSGPPPDHKCYIPKKCIHTWGGHTKAVHRIEFFPKSGHLLLSGSMDHTVKLWAVTGQKRLLRTYKGHMGGVRDINFNHDGTKFMTASYDRYVKMWDTEYGKCISRHTSKRIPFCVRIHPSAEKQYECLVGQGDKLIVQWDTRADEITQKYDEHLASVNTVTFCDEGRRFISTSDDKKVFIWEYGIPVVMKHISEPDMNSMPAVAVHPNGKWWIGQSLDNTIRVYTCGNRFKENMRKVFRGHLNAGYACQLGFSPDGRFVLSGDGRGRAVFWDWKTSRVFKKLQAHDKVCIGATWHPVLPSRVATCSWDGTIKYWD